ncbi:ribose-phosphate diphosphokinase [Halapricum hydrolyticum]|uniref:Ribose-phosphate pyrophosphokinase n=1 Tax=Halapricum hydrolyticum TaxID=2979991 RepID=A0AAE3IDG0_9EURY|nr:ribose-phosphate diphosphokinase [Halapricum hydrolyticum]MCU4719514.1 ribose-phosphate diphosphokinase [Halapricum hydrolyticum]MCU4728202.1 ribose-phosphate diphosphokinase [Halapricum hydrolyticum]
MIVSGSHSQILSAELAAVTGRSLATVEYDRFPDGELKVRVPDPSAERAVVVASTPTSDAHLELLQLQDALREAGVSEIVTVLPYMGYARQDKVFETGDPISARAMARAVSTGADRVLTVNPHEPAVTDFFDVPADTVDAAGRLAEPLPELSDPVFVAPDEGATALAGSVRDAYGGGETDYFEKTRHSSTEVEIEPRDADVADRDVVLTDDIVATGSTMSEAVAALAERDAARVFVTCVHPMLARNAVLKLSAAGVEAIYGTDTLERPVSEVSVAPAIADALSL